MFKQLKVIRVQNKLKQQQVADALGITRSAYCSYEIGRRKVDAVTVKKLSEFYNLPVKYFYEERDAEIGDKDEVIKEYLSQLTKEERDLICRFRVADNQTKEKIFESFIGE